MADTSVMLLEYEHRRQVREENRPWDMIDSDKVYCHLKANVPSAKQNFQKHKQPTNEKGQYASITTGETAI